MILVDLETGMVMIRVWHKDKEGPQKMTVSEAELAAVCNKPAFMPEDWRYEPVQYPKLSTPNQKKPIPELPVAICPQIEPPTAMFELQQKFFIDLVLI
ncbi:uncharacterized protein N7483_012581 [Penicillium malachiteum]|uniref:uncharacterized protein n=1 Tax=Penicillium malachiteum TaxID=1324776 RepID=UPI002547FCC6|nr:uncharacterized protein N7483_012581 [Penicillium malachiteum]KAJ5715400.1 hypothetical protein N7483_012581 [Penicillium malachiteum]